jgi:small subunit ribosomal protein S27e
MSEWNRLIPKPKSNFLRVRCRKCNNEQDIFGSPVNKVTCNVCGALMAEPSGGKARLRDSDVQVILE